MANKIELTWVGKEESIKVEPRLLIEKKEYSNVEHDPNSKNMLIHGDNLLALKALESLYSDQIKCIYIDPPFNAKIANACYDDNLEHSIWLNLMRPRLQILYKLLRDDGCIFVQINDVEQAYLTILMDEIFGRKNHINTICVSMSNASGNKITHAIAGKRFPNLKHYVLIYCKNIDKYKLNIPKEGKGEWDREYNLIIPNLTEDFFDDMDNFEEFDKRLEGLELVSLNDYMKDNDIDSDDNDWKRQNSYRIFSSKPNSALLKKARQFDFNGQVAVIKNASGDNKLIKTDFNRGTKTARIELVSAKDNFEIYYGDMWLDIVTTGGVAQEGGVNFPKGKKPEKLIERIIRCSTNPGDFVLDSFLGSGTTAAVAHKMGRRWIGVEMGNQAYTHCKVRLDKVISGDDKTGITSTVGWEGGGGYRFYELAPSLINQDAHGEYIINKQYNAEQLAAAVALHEGFKYQPDSVLFWKQSVGTEKSYLFVTTHHLSKAYVDSIVCTMEDDEFLVIACCSYDKDIEHEHKNISVKKIPQMLLNRCEFNKDDYSLTIIHPPVYEDEDDEEEEL